MLKRQESSLSSSSRRHAVAAAAATPPPEAHHAKAIGCMSGIFRLFSKHQNPQKRITFGRKQEKLKALYAARSRKSPPAAEEDEIEDRNFDYRSPTLPPEFRSPIAAVSTPQENPRSPPYPSLVARLMGLEDLGAAEAEKKPPAAAEEDRVTEKRRLLLVALEKCNEDLEALKMIIKAVQTADDRVLAPPPEAAGNRIFLDGGNAVDGRAGIPALTRSPLNSVSGFQNSTEGTTRVPHMRKPMPGKKPGEDDEPIQKLMIHESSITESSLLHRRRQAAAAMVPPCYTRALAKSVEEVCGDIRWGEKREVGRIGCVLQDHLCRELVEELVSELRSPNACVLPFDSCKRRLCF